jgi:hypothetical protein
MAEVRLACALRFLAGGQVLDLREIYDFSKSERYKAVSRTLNAVNEATKIEFLIDDNQKLKILEADFCAISRKRK